MISSERFANSKLRRIAALLMGIYLIRAGLYNALSFLIIIWQGRFSSYVKYMQSLFPETLKSFPFAFFYCYVVEGILIALLLALGILLIRSWNIRKWNGLIQCGSGMLVLYIVRYILYNYVERPERFVSPSSGFYTYIPIILYGFACRYFAGKGEER